MNYETQPLEAFLDSLETGKRPRGGSVESGVPSLGGEHVNADCSLKLSPMKYVPEEFFTGMTKGFIHTNDILIVKDGATTGRVGFVDDSFPFARSAVNEHLFIVRADKDKAHPLYLYYFLRSKIGNAQVMSDFRGAAQGGISRGFASKVHIPVRTLTEQRRIVDILSRADGIVLLRREAEKKAAELIPAMFLDMFGDPATNPKGWPVKSLGELCDRITDGTHQPPKFQGSGIPFIFISNIVRGELTLDTTKYISDETYVELTRRCPIEIGDVLYSTVGSYGVPVKVDTEKRFSFQRHIAHIKPQRDKLDSDFLVGMLFTPALKAQADSSARGIAQKTVNLGEIRKFQVIAPPLAQQQRFASRVVAARSIQSQQAAATATAQVTFDALLAQVFS